MGFDNRTYTVLIFGTAFGRLLSSNTIKTKLPEYMYYVIQLNRSHRITVSGRFPYIYVSIYNTLIRENRGVK